MDEQFKNFYRTLDQNAFKYFLKDDSFYVYFSDIELLPADLKPKGCNSAVVKLASIDATVKDMLLNKKIPVFEYCNYALTKRGYPGNLLDFSHLCLDDRIPPSIFAVAIDSNNNVKCAFTKDSAVMNCSFVDDDLLSNLSSLLSMYNCVECLYNDKAFEKTLNTWGIHGTFSKLKVPTEMITSYLKISMPVHEYVKQDCCLVNIADYDLVDFQLETMQGKRLLNQWLRSPSIDHDEIEKRLDLSECFAKINLSMISFFDLKKLISKINNKSINISEIIKLSHMIDQIPKILDALQSCPYLRVEDFNSGEESDVDTKQKVSNNSRVDQEELYRNNLASNQSDYKVYKKKAELLFSTFIDPFTDLYNGISDLSTTLKNKINFKYGRIHTHLSDDLASLEESKYEIYSEVEREYNKVRQAFPKVTFSNKLFKISRLDFNQSNFDEKKYVVVSMLKTGVSFTTKTLSDINERLKAVDRDILRIENEILSEIRSHLTDFVGLFEVFNFLIALMDIYKAFSYKTQSAMYSRPKFSKDKYLLDGIFHPMLENRDCILNDISFDSNVCVLTGPNMGGKSTFIKTLSMVSLYAQIGCYVPAKKAIIPIFDKIFLRIGAKDSTFQQMSTFMVEMVELNKIVRTATRNSLILIDELGRGTSAIDGLSLVISVRDYLLNLGAMTVLATHFSELGDKRTLNKKMNVQGNVLTYKISDGICDTSFGINVAQMANFPKDVVEKAIFYLNKN